MREREDEREWVGRSKWERWQGRGRGVGLILSLDADEVVGRNPRPVAVRDRGTGRCGEATGGA